MKIRISILVLLLFSLFLAACGGGNNEGNNSTEGDTTETVVGDAAHGEELYNMTIIGDSNAPGCVTCHSLEEGVVLVGPSHAGVAQRAGEYVAGQSAEEYLHTSIVNPNAHIVDGFTADVMYQLYENDLSEEDINDLVAYLLTLE